MRVAPRYDGVADWYEGEFRSSRLEELQLETLRRLLGVGTGTLLDIGCRTGVYTAAISQWGWTVRGVDVSDDMLRYARSRGLDVSLADGTDLPFEDGSFDADDFGRMTGEAARVLRERGVFAFFDAGFRLEWFEEAEEREYPHIVALRCRR